jgi:hypothetical protein
MPAHDSIRFDPLVPLAYVTLRNPETGAVLPDVPMLLDSGADVTLIPQAVADEQNTVWRGYESKLDRPN